MAFRLFLLTALTILTSINGLRRSSLVVWGVPRGGASTDGYSTQLEGVKSAAFEKAMSAVSDICIMRQPNSSVKSNHGLTILHISSPPLLRYIDRTTEKIHCGRILHSRGVWR
jgi:hypothetical protein